MGTNFAPGDRVVAAVNLGSVRAGTRGVVTHVSTFHGLMTVNFDGHGEIPSVKLDQVARA